MSVFAFCYPQIGSDPYYFLKKDIYAVCSCWKFTENFLCKNGEIGKKTNLQIILCKKGEIGKKRKTRKTRNFSPWKTPEFLPNSAPGTSGNYRGIWIRLQLFFSGLAGVNEAILGPVTKGLPWLSLVPWTRLAEYAVALCLDFNFVKDCFRVTSMHTSIRIQCDRAAGHSEALKWESRWHIARAGKTVTGYTGRNFSERESVATDWWTYVIIYTCINIAMRICEHLWYAVRSSSRLGLSYCRGVPTSLNCVIHSWNVSHSTII